MKRSALCALLVALAAPWLAAPGWNWDGGDDGGDPTPKAYPVKFQYRLTEKPVANMWIYTDVPGDNAFKLDNRFLTSSEGVGGTLLEGTTFNFYWSQEKLERSVLESRLAESDCAKENTGEPVDGKLIVRLPAVKRGAGP